MLVKKNEREYSDDELVMLINNSEDIILGLITPPPISVEAATSAASSGHSAQNLPQSLVVPAKLSLFYKLIDDLLDYDDDALLTEKYKNLIEELRDERMLLDVPIDHLNRTFDLIILNLNESSSVASTSLATPPAPSPSSLPSTHSSPVSDVPNPQQYNNNSNNNNNN